MSVTQVIISEGLGLGLTSALALRLGLSISATPLIPSNSVTPLEPTFESGTTTNSENDIMNSPEQEEYYNLGSYQRHITASNNEAKTWFNRGLIWCYAFNHEEAVICFEKAIASDPSCAMAYWGVAYALGPNYNKSWSFFDPDELETVVERTHRMVAAAKQCATNASPVERGLVAALQFRYPQQTCPEKRDECTIWNRKYADAMEGVCREFPHDLDVAALCADAMMNLTPWQLWDIQTGKPAAGARTIAVKMIIDGSLAQEGGMQHPGLLHYYIHLMEMSLTPEAALPAADELRTLVPDAGHLNHMPTHIDLLLGHYAHGIQSNQRAIQADDKFLKRSGANNFYTLYRTHDFHFCIYSAMFAGQSKVALAMAADLETSIPEELLRVKSPPMADWLEGFLSMKVHVRIRFGRWRELIDMSLPPDAELYCNTTTMTHYGKAVALAATGKVDEAAKERHLFLEARKRVSDSRMLFNNKCVDILDVAEAMMDGEIAYRRGEYEVAFVHLRQAIARDDGLPYDEPWGWMQPTRHAYGALLIEQGYFQQAAAVYAEDLGLDDKTRRALRHPNNVWSLHGYHECMVKLGRTNEADAIRPQLQAALEGTDVPIRSSCFCRVNMVASM